MSRTIPSDLLAHLVAATGMTQAEAADYVGVSHAAFRLQCRGRSTVPVDTILRIWRVAEGVLGDKALPTDVPEVVERRRKAIADMRSVQAGVTLMEINPRHLADMLDRRDLI